MDSIVDSFIILSYDKCMLTLEIKVKLVKFFLKINFYLNTKILQLLNYQKEIIIMSNYIADLLTNFVLSIR